METPTVVPTTEAMVTEVPTTEAMATEVPTTKAMATEVPTTEAMVTEVTTTAEMDAPGVRCSIPYLISDEELFAAQMETERARQANERLNEEVLELRKGFWLRKLNELGDM